MPTTTDQYKPLVITNVTEVPDKQRRAGSFTRHDGEEVHVTLQQSFNVYWVYVNTSHGTRELAGRVTKQRIGVWSVGSREVGQEPKAIRVGWTFSGKLTEAVERVANEYLNNIEGAFRAAEREARFTTYRVDTRLVRARLEAAGYKVFTTAQDNDDIQVYLDHHNRALIITPDGDVTYTGWDTTGGVASEIEVYASRPSTVLSDVVRETVLFLKRHELEQRVGTLLEYLQTEVPDSVAHYAVEQAKKALQTLQRQAFTVDLLHGKEV